MLPPKVLVLLQCCGILLHSSPASSSSQLWEATPTVHHGHVVVLQSVQHGRRLRMTDTHGVEGGSPAKANYSGDAGFTDAEERFIFLDAGTLEFALYSEAHKRAVKLIGADVDTAEHVFRSSHDMIFRVLDFGNRQIALFNLATGRVLRMHADGLIDTIDSRSDFCSNAWNSAKFTVLEVSSESTGLTLQTFGQQTDVNPEGNGCWAPWNLLPVQIGDELVALSPAHFLNLFKLESEQRSEPYDVAAIFKLHDQPQLLWGWTLPAEVGYTRSAFKNLFYGCPLIFIAAELAVGFGPSFLRNPEVPLEQIKATLELKQRAHIAHAVALADSWRMYANSSEDSSEFRGLCDVLSNEWPRLNELASLALQISRCDAGDSKHYKFSDILGCNGRAVALDSICHPLVVQSPDKMMKIQEFFTTVSENLMLRPRLDPFLDGEYLKTLFPWITRPLPFKSSLHGQPLFLEFGVHTGASLNTLARQLQEAANSGTEQNLVFGFDSFRGLPAYWNGSWYQMGAGEFSVCGALPMVAPNARLVQGWFNETLPIFICGLLAASTGHTRPWVRLAHIDSDLYESAKDVLLALEPLFQAGTVLVFDQLVNYPGFLEGELLALFEFLQTFPRPFRIIYGPWHVAKDLEDLESHEHVGGRFWHKCAAIELLG